MPNDNIAYPTDGEGNFIESHKIYEIGNAILGKDLMEIHVQKYCKLDQIDDLIYDVCSKEFEGQRENIKTLSKREICSIVFRMNILKPNNDIIAKKLHQKCIDGECLISINCMDWMDFLRLNIMDYYCLLHIITLWEKGWKTTIESRSEIPDGLFGCYYGLTSDLSRETKESAALLKRVEEECTDWGNGYFYGRLVVIGFKDERCLDDGKLVTHGPANDQFIMKRRGLPNGWKRLQTIINSKNFYKDLRMELMPYIKIPIPTDSHSSDHIESKDEERGEKDFVIHYVRDPLKDVYTMGRSECNQNDFVIPGIRFGCDARDTGTVSRYACRIECSRLPPYKCYIFAGQLTVHGWDSEYPQSQIINNDVTYSQFLKRKETEDVEKVTNEMKKFKVNQKILSNSTPHSDKVMKMLNDPSIIYAGEEEAEDETIDVFTTYGVKIFQPEVQRWLEVSLRGRTYEPRTNLNTVPTQRVITPLGNEITDGTIIDLSGAQLIFQNPVTMAKETTVDVQKVINTLNELKPKCPVLFSEIMFTYIDPMKREKHQQPLLADPNNYNRIWQPYNGPSADYSHIAEENRSYIFPSCGHVHAYNAFLENKPCPLCRKMGPFVPIAFAFESVLSDEWPTHVFNPCGHVTSESVCEKWSKQRLPCRMISTEICQYSTYCPFCAFELDKEKLYSKIILQTDNGQLWEDFINENKKKSLVQGNRLDNLYQLALQNSCDWHSFFPADHPGKFYWIRRQNENPDLRNDKTKSGFNEDCINKLFDIETSTDSAALVAVPPEHGGDYNVEDHPVHHRIHNRQYFQTEAELDLRKAHFILFERWKVEHLITKKWCNANQICDQFMRESIIPTFPKYTPQLKK